MEDTNDNMLDEFVMLANKGPFKNKTASFSKDGSDKYDNELQLLNTPDNLEDKVSTFNIIPVCCVVVETDLQLGT